MKEGCVVMVIYHVNFWLWMIEKPHQHTATLPHNDDNNLNMMISTMYMYLPWAWHKHSRCLHYLHYYYYINTYCAYFCFIYDMCTTTSHTHTHTHTHSQAEVNSTWLNGKKYTCHLNNRILIDVDFGFACLCVRKIIGKIPEQYVITEYICHLLKCARSNVSNLLRITPHNHI